MKLSTLQKFILLECLRMGDKVDRKVFRGFYETQKVKEKEKSFDYHSVNSGRVAQDKYQESIITKSLEHLIDRELMTGYGRRTPHKWFITDVKLTNKGQKKSLEILNSGQKKLPLR